MSKYVYPIPVKWEGILESSDIEKDLGGMHTSESEFLP